MSKHYRKENNCLNCGQVVNGKFCSNCGQENIEIKEPFWAFVSHGVGHYFHYDSKFKKTLRPFLTKPGQLTKDYMDGRMASHIPPISLYLFITLVYFLSAPVFNKQDVDEKEAMYKVFRLDSYSVQLNKIARLDSAVKHEESEKQRSSDEEILKTYRRINLTAADSNITSYHNRQAALPDSLRDDKITKFWKELKVGYREKTGHTFDKAAFKDKYFPKLLFFLMPLFAFFLMLNFRRNKKLYLEHLIYTIHLFSFAFFTFFVSEFLQYVLPANWGEVIELIFFAILIWYTYRSIRTVYERSRWKTVMKLFTISILFVLSLVITEVVGMAIAISLA
ncbi:DUF3667 domain-containing protein [Daejeonella lutea]|uniref:DUF3667 domain-containing protein n=1 Tax=Daejeonella lutea TaxID=572036 RepID=A0A1T5AMP0_9SPHI|nr:DUF3667 domain-containing protein [Daejeonella lutea]SKB36099.1 Protein of unknown function [Daejeonella lutea]